MDESSAQQRVLTLLNNHKKYTNSQRANYILCNWEQEKHNFIKVIPNEYKLALMKKRDETRTKTA